jgi:hypothetical protein
MKELLALMLSFPPTPHVISDADYDQQIRTLCSNLKQAPCNKLIGDVSEGGSLLDVSLHDSLRSTPRFWRCLLELEKGLIQ